jgi:prepilin peptidase CpaA
MHSFAWWSTLIALAVAILTDLRSRRIPNWLMLPYLLSGGNRGFRPDPWVARLS